MAAYFQPLVELRSGQICGFEVLARWIHPERGVVEPESFVGMAEHEGLAGALMGTVLEEAFRAGQRLPDHLGLSVNVSPFQLRDDSLPEQLESAAGLVGFDLSRLTVELTESALIGNLEHAREITSELKKMGVRVALDDFGTGYSSLQHLHSMPFDEIKVDRAFVRTMVERRESRKIVAAILGLGQSLGLTTVAEGVEEPEQVEMLLWMGCDMGQGWLYGSAMPRADLKRFGMKRRMEEGFGKTEGKARVEQVQHVESMPAQRLSQLQAIYDGAPVGLCFLDSNLRYVSVNKRLSEMNKIPIRAHLGRRMAEVRPRMYEAVEPYLKKALEGKATCGVEMESKMQNCEERGPLLMLSFQPALDEAGEVVGVSVSAMDITQRESTLEALRESEENYRYTVELSPQVPWTADAKGNILDVSARWESLTGLTREESLGTGWVKAVHPDDVRATVGIWRESLRTGKSLDVEFRVGRGDGCWRWVRSRAAARFDDEFRVVRWYGTLEDIDEQKRANEELRENRAMLQAVFNAVPVGLVIAEAPSGKVMMGNPQAEAVLGHEILPKQDVGSQETWVAFHTDGSRLMSDEYPLVRAITKGESTEAEEYLYQKRDGTLARVSLTAAPIRDEEGEVTGGVVAIREVSQGGD